MASKCLSSLNQSERQKLEKELFNIQKGKCFICEEPIDWELHGDALDVDHIEPLSQGGKDNVDNFALTHSHCNRSKQAADLRIARILARFEKIKNEVEMKEQKSPSLKHILKINNGSQHDFKISIEDDIVKYSFPNSGDNKIYQSNLLVDNLSYFKSFYAEIPLSYLFHDDKINPRGIAQESLRKLLEEFHRKRPQLHIALARLLTKKDSNNGSDSTELNKIFIFDGQHKAAAQIFLGVKKLPVRIFIDPDLDILLTTNTNAGDQLRQVAFDKSIKRQLGHSLFVDRISRYQQDHNLSEDDESFSERQLIDHFRGEAREIKRYILDFVRNSITQHRENMLREFIDFEGKGKKKPISYSTIDKTFYSLFLHQEPLTTPLNYKADIGENPRTLEIEQMVKLMNIIAEEIYHGKYNQDLGVNRIENKLREGEDIPEEHLTAVRMSKEEIMYNWLQYIKSIINNFFAIQGKTIPSDRFFQEPFSDLLWQNIRNFTHNLASLPLWKNKELSSTLFGGKQNYSYWEHIFRTGETIDGKQVLAKPLNIIEMIKNY
ncbi:MAG TPA: HNH endonuclease signature motif containing protein [Candidatus Pacearchaeota archaeon]|nr:HNH endonuclease signature motif containing protein [Candidatus Pacearchaeota archaeon]